MRLHRLYPPLFFALALLGGLTVARAQAPNLTVGGVYNSTLPSLTDKQLATFQLDNDGGLNAYASNTTTTGTITTQNLNLTGTATTGSAVTAVALDARGTTNFQISGTWTGTLVAQISTDGSTWVTMINARIWNQSNGIYTSNIPSGATGIFSVGSVGAAQIRVTASTAVTGTANVTMLTSQPAMFVHNVQAAYAAYDASVIGLVPQAAATDIACLSNSSTKKVAITKITVSGIATAATVADIVVVKRSTNNTGGTSAVATNVPRDSLNPTATGVLTSWTANPAALGTLAGTVDAQKLTLPTSAGAAAYVPFSVEFSGIFTQPKTIRGTEAYCINYNGQTIGGNSLNVHFAWVEQ
jgi:hypothetical protein